MIQRGLIITIYLLIVEVIKLNTYYIFGTFFHSAVEIFFYSLLHAYYCYEYKTAAMDLKVLQSITLFEHQWEYFLGFGFIFTVFLFLCKEIGSSLFFLFFPVMVMISLDENG